MLLLEKFCSLTTFWSFPHLRKLNGELGSESSDLPLNHPNFPCLFCTKIFDQKSEVVERLDTCDGTEDLSAMIHVSVMSSWEPYRQPPLALRFSLDLFQKIFKENGISYGTYRGTEVQTHRNFQCAFFARKPLEYWKFCETHCQSPLVQMQTLFVHWYALILTSLKTTLITMKWEYFMSSLLVQT